MSGLPSELLHTLTGHEGPVLNVRFNPKGTYCISCGKVRSSRGMGMSGRQQQQQQQQPQQQQQQQQQQQMHARAG